MPQDIADWAGHAGAAGLNRWKSGTHAVPTNHRDGWDRLQHQPQYRHFSRIPRRILSCLDYFKVSGNQVAVAEVLGAYYIFIGVVDNCIDSGMPKTAETVFELLEAYSPGEDPDSEVPLVTMRLRRHISQQIKPQAIEGLRQLYAVVLEERSADSIEQYVDRRTAVGHQTADLSYILIRPLLLRDEEGLRNFMKRVGAVGCLLDTVIDWRADRRHGLLGFHPTFHDYLKLLRATAATGLSLALEHPRLCWLFIQSTLDIFRDRLVKRSTSLQIAR